MVQKTPQVAGFFYGCSSTTVMFTSWLATSLEMAWGAWVEMNAMGLDLAV
jgi:hypothetical protein